MDKKHHAVFGLSAGYPQTQKNGFREAAGSWRASNKGIAPATPGVGFEPQGRGENASVSLMGLQPVLGFDMHQQSILFVAKEAMSNIILLTYP